MHSRRWKEGVVSFSGDAIRCGLVSTVFASHSDRVSWGV